MARKVVHKGFYTDLEGVEKTINKIGLYEIDKKENIKKIIKRAARKTVTAAKKRVTFVKTGDTKKSIKAKYFQYGLMATVKPRLPKGYKAHWFEYGTKERSTKKGKSTGKIDAQPFMGPAEAEIRPKYLMELRQEVNK